MRYRLSGILTLGLLVGSFGTAQLHADDAPVQTDNTKMNQRDQSNNRTTADQAKNNKSDREIMQQIRKSIVADKSLSSYAHNIKIIAKNGMVTLKGPVRSEAERATVLEKAKSVVQADSVTDQMDIKSVNN